MMDIPKYLARRLERLQFQLDMPELDFVNSEADLLLLVMKFDLKLIYFATQDEAIRHKFEMLNSSTVRKSGGLLHFVYVVTNDPGVPVELVRADAVYETVMDMLLESGGYKPSPI